MSRCCRYIDIRIVTEVRIQHIPAHRSVRILISCRHSLKVLIPRQGSNRSARGTERNRSTPVGVNAFAAETTRFHGVHACCRERLDNQTIYTNDALFNDRIGYLEYDDLVSLSDGIHMDGRAVSSDIRYTRSRRSGALNLSHREVIDCCRRIRTTVTIVLPSKDYRISTFVQMDLFGINMIPISTSGEGTTIQCNPTGRESRRTKA